MCLPCFPWTWTQYEDPLDSMPEHSLWVHDGQAWVLQQIVSLCAFLSVATGSGCPGDATHTHAPLP